MDIQENVLLSKYTTLGIGGPARYFAEVTNEEELKEAIAKAGEMGAPFFIMAGGSNLLVNDEGYNGLVIKVNIQGIKQYKASKLATGVVRVKAGTPLEELVDFANAHGLAGAQKLTGIPGTVGGAIYGNAGAYGQTISDKLRRIRMWNSQKRQERWLAKNECRFEYRDSGFKKMPHSVILEAEFEFDKANSRQLKATSEEILNRRLQKYPPGVRCPGSFFKNLLARDLPEVLAAKIPIDYYGKMPAGYFLDLAGAKGAKLGNIKIADYHANLFINEGGGRAEDFYQLAKEWKQKVKDKFGIELEPEVQLVGFKDAL